MSDEKINLSVLLNDESFIYWLKQDDRLSDSDKEKWNQWLSSSKKNKRLFKRAKKIIEMPFKEVIEGCDSGELHRLKEAIKKADSNIQE